MCKLRFPEFINIHFDTKDQKGPNLQFRYHKRGEKCFNCLKLQYHEKTAAISRLLFPSCLSFQTDKKQLYTIITACILHRIVKVSMLELSTVFYWDRAQEGSSLP